jgi:cytochrome b subunit of formate dehydrogenase
MEDRVIKQYVHYILGILVILVLISGLGIIYYQIMGFLTLGYLSKDLAFKIHTLIFIPFLIVLIMHSFMSWILKK